MKLTHKYIIQSFDKSAGVWFPIAKVGKRYFRVHTQAQALHFNYYLGCFCRVLYLRRTNKWLGKLRIVKV